MMDGSQGTSGGPAPFLSKIYEMIDDPVTNDVVSWSQTGHSFVVWNPPDFARDLLPKYFKHNNFSSFIRQLNTYGFRKVDPDQWEFANEDFIRGQMLLLKNIHRRKPIHSHTIQGNASVQMSDQEREEFQKEIEKLKHENGSLQLEMESHKQENQAYEFGMKSLRQCLLNIDQKQRHLKTRLAELLQKPELTSSVVQQSELQNKKRRSLVSNYLYDQASRQGRPIITLCDNDSNEYDVPTINLELIESLDTCVGFWENFFQDVVSDLSMKDDYEFSILKRQSPLIVSDAHTSSGDSDLNIQPKSPPQSHSTSSPPREVYSSPGSSNRAGSPIISSTYTNLASKAKTSGIDVNSSPNNADSEEPKNIQGGTSHSAPTGANDVFWQQFLTETPGSSDTPEVQSESSEHHCRSRLVTPNGSWWNVDSLSKQMGHLTPTERT